jgi:MFS family permease
MLYSNNRSHQPFVALQYRDFRFFLGTQLTYTIGVLMQEVVLGYHLYEMTGDVLALGIIGLLEAIPYLCLALFGGILADKFNKKHIAQICITSMILISIILNYCLSTIEDVSTKKYVIYLAVFSIGVARGFMGPAWSSMKAFLVKREHQGNAASWSSQFWQSGMILGPTIAGFLYGYQGLMNTLIVVVILFFIALISASMIETSLKNERIISDNVFEQLKEGFRFVRKSKILLSAIALDMFSVLFGGVVAILPVFAKDILHVGPEGLGILRAAPGIGAVITIFLTAFFPPTTKAWRNMLLAVAGFGVATLIFAFSKNIYLSAVALFFTGVFDSISVVVRQTILQILPPDEMRGRVNSINGLFVSCSNELGALESGVAAKIMGIVPSVVFGGVMTLVIVVFIYSKTKDLLDIDLLKIKSISST